MPRAPLHPRRHYRWWQPIVTRWSDNDVYGHVNNAVYYHWFDTAVNTWLIDGGLLDPAIGDPIALVAETSCRYAKALHYPQLVEIGLSLDRLGTSSVTYRLGAFARGDEDAAAEALFTHVVVGRADRRPVPFPAEWRERFATLG